MSSILPCKTRENSFPTQVYHAKNERKEYHKFFNLWVLSLFYIEGSRSRLAGHLFLPFLASLLVENLELFIAE